jgi:hypothetical protein
VDVVSDDSNSHRVGITTADLTCFSVTIGLKHRVSYKLEKSLWLSMIASNRLYKTTGRHIANTANNWTNHNRRYCRNWSRPYHVGYQG